MGFSVSGVLGQIGWIKEYVDLALKKGSSRLEKEHEAAMTPPRISTGEVVLVCFHFSNKELKLYLTLTSLLSLNNKFELQMYYEKCLLN